MQYQTKNVTLRLFLTEVIERERAFVRGPRLETLRAKVHSSRHPFLRLKNQLVPVSTIVTLKPWPVSGPSPVSVRPCLAHAQQWSGHVGPVSGYRYLGCACSKLLWAS